MKFGMSSSGCEPRPAKGEPAQPVVSLAAAAVTRPAMRRCTKVWAVGKAATKTKSFWVPRASNCSKARVTLPRIGQAESHPAGCTTTARSKRTAQAPGRPTFLLGKTRSNGDPVITLRRAARPWMRVRPADATQVAPQRRSVHAEVDQGKGRPELRSTGTRESEGCIGAATSGNGWHPDPAEQRRPVLN